MHSYLVGKFFTSLSLNLQVVWFGKDGWLGLAAKSTTRHLKEHEATDSLKSSPDLHDESTCLLTSAVLSSIQNDPLKDCTTQVHSRNKVPISNLNSNTRTYRQVCAAAVCCVSMVYIVVGLIAFAMGLFWRTGTFVALLGPLTCLLVVLAASEYYHVKRNRRCNNY